MGRLRPRRPFAVHFLLLDTRLILPSASPISTVSQVQRATSTASQSFLTRHRSTPCTRGTHRTVWEANREHSGLRSQLTKACRTCALGFNSRKHLRSDDPNGPICPTCRCLLRHSVPQVTRPHLAGNRRASSLLCTERTEHHTTQHHHPTDRLPTRKCLRSTQNETRTSGGSLSNDRLQQTALDRLRLC